MYVVICWLCQVQLDTQWTTRVHPAVWQHGGHYEFFALSRQRHLSMHRQQRSWHGHVERDAHCWGETRRVPDRTATGCADNEGDAWRQTCSTLSADESECSCPRVRRLYVESVFRGSPSRQRPETAGPSRSDRRQR